LGSGQSLAYWVTSGGIAATVAVGVGGVVVDGEVVGAGVVVVAVGVDEQATRTTRAIINARTNKYLRLAEKIPLIVFPFKA
jgi:urocanate hydratase